MAAFKIDAGGNIVPDQTAPAEVQSTDIFPTKKVFDLTLLSANTALPTPVSGHYSLGATSAGLAYMTSAGTIYDVFDEHSPVVSGGIAALTSSATIALDTTAANVFTLTPAHTATINAAALPARGQWLVLSVLTSGTTSYTLTFGTNFISTGTLATGTTTAKRFTVSFISDGVKLVEVARTAAM